MHWFKVLQYQIVTRCVCARTRLYAIMNKYQLMFGNIKKAAIVVSVGERGKSSVRWQHKALNVQHLAKIVFVAVRR